MKIEQCPPQDDLSAFVRCQVSEEQAESISEHVATCPQCEETVVGLEQSAGTVFDRLKGIPASFPFQDEPELARMAQAVKQRPPGTSSEESDSPPPVAMPEQLRDYRILEKIGEGGMGAVYRAMHTRLNKIVAIKVLSTSRLKDEAAISRFQREISIVGRLQHPNIVQAHDAGEENGQHFLVMEYVEGTDLSEIVRRNGPLPVKAACELVAQAATGLQYAYENGLVHRDIKPSNLMLSVSGGKQTNEVNAAVVKILDLGLARLHTDDQQTGPELTTDGQIMGTLDYMAPEQGGDSRAVDIRSDIYSLGATLYKLLTGEALFGGERHRSVMQKLTALATEPAPSVRGRRPEVPEPLAAIIARMLSKRPQDRFCTPAEVASALQPFRAGAELPTLLGLSSRPPDSVPLSPTVQLASHNQPPKSRRPFALATMWFCGAAALFAIILTITTKQGTIEVESPDGKLPDDVKVVVSRGGDGVEVLQADNQWRASVAGGKFQLSLQGGADRFELQDSTLTVSRFGKNVVTLRVKQAAAAPVVVEKDKDQPKPVATNANHGKPFVVMRKGERTGAFNSLYGAVSAVAVGDVVEVHSNGPVILTMPEAVNKPLHLRAGKGYRPMLVLRQQLVVNQGLVIEDCDIDQRGGNWPFVGPSTATWEFRRCRFWGRVVADCRASRISLEDCIFDTYGGFNFYATEAREIRIANCAIRSMTCFLVFPDGEAPVNVHLSGNTFRFYHAGNLAELAASVKSSFACEATSNLFEFTSQHPASLIGIDKSRFVDGNRPANVDWIGRDNMYCGNWRAEAGADGKVISGLAVWNKLWKQPEQNSREIPRVAFTGARSGDWSSLDRLAGIRTAVETIKTQNHLDELGPDWSLVGVGDSYVRALSAQGKTVPKDRLRPEVHPDGHIIIIRNDVEFKGFLTLTAAFEAAETGDIIEIRTDDPIPGPGVVSKARRLTLRAGPGYSPIINGPFDLGDVRAIVEGLTFREGLATAGIPPWVWNRDEGPPFPGNGSIERLTNCVFLNSNVLQVWGWFRGEGDQVPEITNCVLGQVAAGVPGGKKLLIKNSVLASAWISVDGKKEPGHLEISDSLLWSPDSGSSGVCPIQMLSPLTIASRNSVFLAPSDLIATNDIRRYFQGWTGAGNVYIKPSGFIDSIYDGTGAIFTLDEMRNLRKTDSDSVELRPLSFDAANWRIWRERSTGYQPRGEETDFGADIDRLLKALIVDAAAAK